MTKYLVGPHQTQPDTHLT